MSYIEETNTLRFSPQEDRHFSTRAVAEDTSFSKGNAGGSTLHFHIFRSQFAIALGRTVSRQVSNWPQLRQQDVSEPLVAVADLAGEQSGKNARTALTELFGSIPAADESIGVTLLSHIHAAFDGQGARSRAASLSAKQRKEIAVKAAKARWASKSKKKGKP